MGFGKKSSESNSYYVDQSRSRSLWYYILHGLLILLTLAFAAGLVMAYLSTRISPMQNWVFAFFGLMAPFLFLGNFIILLVWAIRWRGWFLLPLVVLLFGLGHFGALLQLNFKKEYPQDTKEMNRQARRFEYLTVMTYNVHGFSYKQKDRDGYNLVLDSVAAYAGRMNPDVICLQEYETTSLAAVGRVDSLFGQWPHREFNYVIGGENGVGFGMAIFSRLPIAASEKMIFDGSGNSMMYADLIMKSDTVRVFNNHLQTTQIDDDIQRRVEKFNLGGDTEQLVRNMGSRLKANYQRRSVQVDTVSHWIAQTRYPVVVVGDFNDTPVSYTYKKMRGELVDPFTVVGKGYAYTYNRLFSMLRIDYIFHSPVFEPESYRSDELPWSDHNPVVVMARRRPEER